MRHGKPPHHNFHYQNLSSESRAHSQLVRGRSIARSMLAGARWRNRSTASTAAAAAAKASKTRNHTPALAHRFIAVVGRHIRPIALRQIAPRQACAQDIEVRAQHAGHPSVLHCGACWEEAAPSALTHGSSNPNVPFKILLTELESPTITNGNPIYGYRTSSRLLKKMPRSRGAFLQR